MTTLRSRLLGALMALLSLNGAYFLVGLRTVARMNKMNADMYDKVVMSGTYVQMARGEFWRYSDEVGSALIEGRSKSGVESWAQSEDAATSLNEDLKVVRERLLDPENAKAMSEFDEDFKRLHAKAMGFKTAGLGGVSLLNAWNNDPGRIKALSVLTDLSDRVVADGYNYRLWSEEHAKFVQRAALTLSLAVLLVNLLCISYILISILPRLKLLAQTCVEIASGRFEKRVSIRSKDEFGSLASSFNTMLEVVRDREERLNEELITTSAMVNSLGQGFLMFGPSGICLDAFSKSCFELFETMPAGKSIAQVLGVGPDDLSTFEEWIKILFAGEMDFEDVAGLGPKMFNHKKKLHITLEYKPVFGAKGHLKSVVVIATDRTEAVVAQKLVDQEQAFSRMVMRFVRHRGDFTKLLARLDDLIQQLPKLPLPQILRHLHTIKGAAATYSVHRVAEAAHNAETALLMLDRSKDLEIEIHVEVDKLRSVFEAVVSELRELGGLNFEKESERRELELGQIRQFYRKVRLEGTPELAHAFLTGFVMRPAKTFLAPYAETLAQIANRLEKKIAPLKITGGETPLLAEIYEPLLETFVHAFRNAGDHGIESPEERRALGKPEWANVEVTVNVIGEDIEFSIVDDGRGVDLARLRRKLDGRGRNAQNLSDDETLQMLFQPGFSTAEGVSDLSGRGVGLDAIMTEAQRLGGQAYLSSKLGLGVTVRVVVPHLIEERRSEKRSA